MGGSKKQQIPVSVIIPVYNVYDWIDQCMESVVNQTFTDFEVILINDGSTDNSEKKCWEWAERDSRIRVISKKNGGPSSARNCGIHNANGEFLVFIDPDDWIDYTYLQKLYTAVTETKASIAECNMYKYNNNTKKQTYHVCSGNMGLEYTLEEHMKYGSTAIWKCIFRKNLFTDYGVVFPNCHSEARAVYPLLLALSGKIVNVHEGLYYYRVFRPQSLSEKPRINNGDEKAVGLLAFDNLLQNFRDCGLYDKYEQVLQEIVKIKLSGLLAGLFYRREKEEFLRIAERYYNYIERKFPGTLNFPYVTFGGYNLNRILGYMNVLHNPYGRFNFSSVISVMNPVMKQQCIHRNKYREIMIRRDITSSFWNIIEDVKPKYIFMDFIEERFDVITYQGGYLTKSDAFDSCEKSPEAEKVIVRDSEECMTLWKESALEFIYRMRECYPETKIVLIKNFLAEKKGDVNSQEFFDDLNEIRKINRILKEYYTFFQKYCETAKIVEASECRYYFTDKEYEYGVIPSHLNELVNREIAEKIGDCMKL